MSGPHPVIKCGRCGWLHIGISFPDALERAGKLTAYLRTLPPERRAEWGGSDQVRVERFMTCTRCGAAHTEAVPAAASDVPMGATLHRLVDPRLADERPSDVSQEDWENCGPPLTLVRCGACGWVHVGITREAAGDRAHEYERCDCGASYREGAVTTDPVSDGWTLAPILLPPSPSS